ncbi:MAG: hypothetical protein J5U19_15915 [Candidatus Methanoperedens sp.]|nr:hypothetical protein [Candidatus Methanoperedens sp.]
MFQYTYAGVRKRICQGYAQDAARAIVLATERYGMQQSRMGSRGGCWMWAGLSASSGSGRGI